MDYSETYDNPDGWNRYIQEQPPLTATSGTEVADTDEAPTLTLSLVDDVTTADTAEAVQTDPSIAKESTINVTISEGTSSMEFISGDGDGTGADSIVVDVDPESFSRQMKVQSSMQAYRQMNQYWKYFAPVFNTTGDLLYVTCKHCLLSVSPKPHRLEMHLNSNKGCRIIADTIEITSGGTPESDLSKDFEYESNSCFICGKLGSGRRRRCAFETFEFYPPEWRQSIGKSLCKLLELEEALEQNLSLGTYCSSCAQLLRDINWVQKSIKILNTKLTSFRDTVIRRIGDSSYATLMGRGKEWKSSRAAFILNLKTRVAVHDSEALTHGELPSRSKMSVRQLKSESLQVAISPGDDIQPKVETLDETTAELETVGASSDPFGDQHGVALDDMDWVPPTDGEEDDPPVEFPEPKPTTRLKTKKSAEELKNKWKKYNKAKIPCAFPSCRQRFIRPCKAEVHFRKVHENDPLPYHCSFVGCHLKFDIRKKLELHRRSHAGEKRSAKTKMQSLPCPIAGCSRIFKERRLLNAHIQNFHIPKINYLYCQYCTKSFRKNVNEKIAALELREHEALHTNHAVPFSCVLASCGKSFSTSRDLRRHVGSEHEENRFTCPLCPGTVFSLKSSLGEHRRRAHPTSTRSYACEFSGCGYVGASTFCLRSHAQSHNEERPYRCDQCPMAYKTKRNLQSHFNMIHSTETPYGCQHCEQKFKSSRLLNIHEARNHTSTPISHLCSGCGKEFGCMSNLTTHINYRCPKGPAFSAEEIVAHREKCREASRSKRARWRELYGYDRLPVGQRDHKSKNDAIDTDPLPGAGIEHEVEIPAHGTGSW